MHEYSADDINRRPFQMQVFLELQGLKQSQVLILNGLYSKMVLISSGLNSRMVLISSGFNCVVEWS